MLAHGRNGCALSKNVIAADVRLCLLDSIRLLARGFRNRRCQFRQHHTFTRSPLVQGEECLQIVFDRWSHAVMTSRAQDGITFQFSQRNNVNFTGIGFTPMLLAHYSAAIRTCGASSCVLQNRTQIFLQAVLPRSVNIGWPKPSSGGFDWTR